MANFQKAEAAGIAFLRNPGVNLVCQGEKIRNGIQTGETCLVFGVTEKKSVPDAEKIPGKLQGITTDVITVAPFKAHADPKLKYRPVAGGISGCVGLNSAATLGGVVWDTVSGKLVGLTNNHAAGLRYDPEYAAPSGGAVFTAGMDFLQPSHGDGGSPDDDVLGTVVRAHPMQFGLAAGTPVNFIDAALISLPGLNVAWFNILNLHAGPFPFAGKTQWSVGATVGKSGRTTGMTTGTVTSKTAAVSVSYGDGDHNQAIFSDQILISGTGFGSPGDSGSLLTTIINGKLHIIGLYFAGDGTSVGIANPIQTVSETLGIDAWDGSVILPRSLAPDVTVNSTAFVWGADTGFAITHEGS